MPSSVKRTDYISDRAQLTRQLYESDLYVIDLVTNPPDNASGAFDLYSVISATTDYINMAVTYGEMQWLSVDFDYTPFFRYSATATDYSIGVFATRQGTFDTTVTTKSPNATAELPGSFIITNKDPWSFRSPVVHKLPISTSDNNTAQSEVPKYNYYLSWSTPATTNAGLGVLHLRLVMKCFSKKE